MTRGAIAVILASLWCQMKNLVKAKFRLVLILNLFLFSSSFVHAQDESSQEVDQFVENYSSNPGKVNEEERSMLRQAIIPILRLMNETRGFADLSPSEREIKIKDWLDNDLRKAAMVAESFFQIYSKYPKKKKDTNTVKNAFEFVKVTMEDPIGTYKDDLATYENLEKYWLSKRVGNDWISDPLDSFTSPSTGITIRRAQVLAAQYRITEESKAKFISLLIDNGWSEPDESSKFQRFLEFVDVDWPNHVHNYEFLIDEMTTEVKKFMKEDYDISELQEGLHEMRRDLRRIAIYLDISKDVVLLGADQSTDQKLRSRLSTFVKDLGDAKDDGELFERFGHAIAKSLIDGFNASEEEAHKKGAIIAQEFLNSRDPQPQNWQAQAGEICQVILSGKDPILKDIKKGIEKSAQK